MRKGQGQRAFARLGAAAIMAAAMLGAAGTAAAAIMLVASTFDADTEGWRQQTRGPGPAIGGSSAVNWVSTGGDPGGFVRLTAPSEGVWSYWRAPAAFNGDRRAYEEGFLMFSLRSNQTLVHAFTINSPGTGHDVEIDSGAGQVYYDIPGPDLAANVWHRFSLPLDGTGWRFSAGDAAVSSAQFETVLSQVNDLRIRAEWSTAVDTDDLDTVALTAPALALSQVATSGEVGSSHCVGADLDSTSPSGVPIRFATSGATSTSGTEAADADGRATYCYDGPLASGPDTITAYPDLDGDGTQDVNEPSEQLSFSWTAPLASDGCKLTLGGVVTTGGGAQLSFGGSFRVRNAAPLGSFSALELTGTGERELVVVSVSTLSCDPEAGTAEALGTVSVDGGAPQPFRLDVLDTGEPGSADTFRLRVTGALDTGTQTLSGGNIQLHKAQ